MYCTVTEVRAAIKDDALDMVITNDHINDPEEQERRIAPIVEAAIADADAEIDGYLAKRYRVPLNPAPRILNKFSKDIAAYNLFTRAGLDEVDGGGVIRDRYNAAIKFLTLLAQGKVSVGPETEDPAGAASGSFAVHSPGRLFNRERLEGM